MLLDLRRSRIFVNFFLYASCFALSSTEKNKADQENAVFHLPPTKSSIYQEVKEIKQWPEELDERGMDILSD